MLFRVYAWMLLVSTLFLSSPGHGAETTYNNFAIDTSDRAEVVETWKSIFLPTTLVDSGWTGDISNGNAGTTSTAFKQAALARLNWYRAMAGLHTDLEIDEAFSAKCQLASLVLAANNVLTHYLDPSWIYYSEAAAEAALRSSIGRGVDSSTGIISSCIEEFGETNAFLGRRMDLFAEIADSYAIGLIPSGQSPRFPLLAYGANTTNTGTAHVAAPPTRDEFIAWPSAGYFPYVPIPARWSFHFSETAEAEYGDSIRLDDVSIEVSCKGVSVPVKIISRPKGRGGWVVFSLWGIDDAIRHNAQTKSLLLGGGSATVPLQETPPTYDYLVPPGSTFDDITYSVKVSNIRVNESWEYNPSNPEGGPAGDGFFPSGGKLKTVEYDVTFINPDAPAPAAHSPIASRQSEVFAMGSINGSSITGEGGAVFDNAGVVVIGSPSPFLITTQPTSATINPGKSATLTVTTNATNPTYQWYQGEANDTSKAISGAKSASLKVSPTSTTTYWVRISVSSGQYVNSQSATVTVAIPVSITKQPAAASVKKGDSTTLSVTAAGDSPTYQWYSVSGKNNVAISGGTASTVTVSPTANTSYWVQVKNQVNSVNSAQATVSVLAPVAITKQPVAASAVKGKSTTLAVSATGDALKYQWYTGQTGDTSKPISKATAASVSVAPSVATSYWVQVKNNVSSIDSAAATVSVVIPVSITKQPTAASVKKGDSTTLSVTAAGDSPTYQWYSVSGKNNVAISGATSSTVTVSPTKNTNYWVQVKNSVNSVNSASATVSVVVPVAITKHPVAASVVKGKSTTLAVSATGDALKYQWYTGQTGDTTKPISKATASSVSVAPSVATSYWVQVKNNVSSIDSAAATVSVIIPVSITKQPAAASVKKGDSTTLSVTVAGDSPTYQWYSVSGKNNIAISGATNSTVTVSPTANTNYWVQVKNSASSVNSSSATVSVVVPVTITKEPVSLNLAKGKSGTLSVSAKGDALKYQWYNGASGDTSSPISKATGSSISLAPNASTDYWVRVWNSVSSSDSLVVAINVMVPVKITQQPVATKIVKGSSTPATLSVTASGDSLKYQWYYVSGKDSIAISGAKNSSLTVSPNANTKYWVQVRNSVSSVNSATVTLSVLKPMNVTGLTAPISIAKGKSATLTITATGDGLKYQWYQGLTPETSQPISKATGASLKVTPKTTTTYWIVVNNGITGVCLRTAVFVGEPVPYNYDLIGGTLGGTLTLGATFTVGGITLDVSSLGGTIGGTGTITSGPGTLILTGTTITTGTLILDGTEFFTPSFHTNP